MGRWSNSKSEYQNPKQILNSNDRNLKPCFEAICAVLNICVKIEDCGCRVIGFGYNGGRLKDRSCIC